MIIAILLQYLFMCAITFFCLEALYTYSLITYVVPVKGYLSSMVNILLGYGNQSHAMATFVPIVHSYPAFQVYPWFHWPFRLAFYTTTMGTMVVSKSILKSIFINDRNKFQIFSCWCDLGIGGTGQAWAFLFPVCFGAFCCAVIAEAQGQGKYEPLPGTDEDEYRAAK